MTSGFDRAERMRRVMPMASPMLAIVGRLAIESPHRASPRANAFTTPLVVRSVEGRQRSSATHLATGTLFPLAAGFSRRPFIALGGDPEVSGSWVRRCDVNRKVPSSIPVRGAKKRHFVRLCLWVDLLAGPPSANWRDKASFPILRRPWELPRSSSLQPIKTRSVHVL